MRISLYLDPPSHHFLGDRLFDITFAGTCGDQFLAPYVFLKQHLNTRGIEVRTADFLPGKPDGALNLYVSTGMLSRYRLLAAREDVVLSAFLAIECPTVEPANYRELNRAQRFFRRIYSWTSSSALEPFVGAPLRCQRFHWPQSFEAVHERIWLQRERGFLVMINGNKSPRYPSLCPELYSERLKAVEYFSRTRELNLYGVGWDGPKLLVGRPCVPGTFGMVPMPGTIQALQRALLTRWQRIFPDPQLQAARLVYRGTARSKAEVLGRHKFAICFENSILEGWITEKIFDCFFAGTVPVYWGAPDIERYIPSGCFIDMRQFSSYADLSRFLHSLSDSDIQGYKERARSYLASPAYTPFTRQAFAQLFVGIIEEDAGVRLGGPVSAASKAGS